MNDSKSLKKPQLIHIVAGEDNKCLENSDNYVEDAVPLGLTGKAVCMQVINYCWTNLIYLVGWLKANIS